MVFRHGRAKPPPKSKVKLGCRGRHPDLFHGQAVHRPARGGFQSTPEKGLACGPACAPLPFQVCLFSFSCLPYGKAWRLCRRKGPRLRRGPFLLPSGETHANDSLPKCALLSFHSVGFFVTRIESSRDISRLKKQKGVRFRSRFLIPPFDNAPRSYRNRDCKDDCFWLALVMLVMVLLSSYNNYWR